MALLSSAAVSLGLVAAGPFSTGGTAVAHAAGSSLIAAAPLPSLDYSPAEWVPADPANYTVSDRPAGYQVNMIVIHDIEGSVDSAITAFQDPARAGSAHYIVGEAGGIWQMVAEKDIAWHAGNWDYNTRAIGIEHEGWACCNYYTTAEYNTSARLAASICSRWGVPLDRAHVIAHSEVPDPNNPGLFGGEEHHTDPGPYWNWSYYLGQARYYAGALPSSPHMGPDPVAVSENGSALVSWQPAQTCRKPITGYQVVVQPGGTTISVPAGQTSLWVPGLTNGTSYTFTVTANNPDGQSTLTSNSAIPSPGCAAAHLATSVASPQGIGASVTVTASSTGCNTPRYAFWLNTPGSGWNVQKDYSTTSTWTWNTAGLAPGTYQLGVWARQVSSNHSVDSYAITSFTLGVGTCITASMTPSAAPPAAPGTMVTFTAAATGCPAAQYQFWLLAPGGSWTVKQPYGANTWTWDTTGIAQGVYQVGVWARQTGLAGSYDTFYVTTYVIGSGAGCVVPPPGAGTPSPAPVGSSITFNTQPSGCTGSQYKFWLLPPGGSWTVVQQYGNGTTWTWNTAGLAPGAYEVGVWAGSAGTPSQYSTYAITSITLGVPTCASASMSPAKASPQPPGTTVTFTATSTGCANASYEFWVLPPAGTWTVKQAYGGSTWAWNTTGLAPGTYQVGVWARQSGSTAPYDAYFIQSYQVLGPACASASVSAAPASPQPAGTSVTFTATTTGCTSPLYEFLGQGPGGAWEMIRALGPSATFTWNSAGSPTGAYGVAVWAVSAGATGDYEAYAVTSFTIS